MGGLQKLILTLLVAEIFTQYEGSGAALDYDGGWCIGPGANCIFDQDKCCDGLECEEVIKNKAAAFVCSPVIPTGQPFTTTKSPPTTTLPPSTTHNSSNKQNKFATYLFIMLLLKLFAM